MIFTHIFLAQLSEIKESKLSPSFIIIKDPSSI